MGKVLLSGILLLVAVVGFFLVKNTLDSPTIKCPADLFICLDGTPVGREGAKCDFAACPSPAATSTANNTEVPVSKSGVHGTVKLGPMCPVQRDPPDPQCADKPFATAIVVYRAESSIPYLIGNSDSTGTFALPLPPGNYTLKAGGDTALPRCVPKDVTVTKNTFVTTSISCDTGIR